jgi:hypothetical protein
MREEACETDAAEPDETLELRRACDQWPDMEITGRPARRLMSEDDRRREADRRHRDVRSSYDVRRTVDDHRRLIGELPALATRPALDSRGAE